VQVRKQYRQIGERSDQGHGCVGILGLKNSIAVVAEQGRERGARERVFFRDDYADGVSRRFCGMVHHGWPNRATVVPPSHSATSVRFSELWRERSPPTLRN